MLRLADHGRVAGFLVEAAVQEDEACMDPVTGDISFLHFGKRYLCAMYLRVFILYTVKEKERDFQYDYFINKVRLPYC